MSLVSITGTFDDLRSDGIRFLEEAAKHGEVEVGLFTDEAIAERGLPPAKYPFDERLYLLESIRYVYRVVSVRAASRQGHLPHAEDESDATGTGERPEGSGPFYGAEFPSGIGRIRGLEAAAFSKESLRAIPIPSPLSVDPASARKRVIVTGCFDWFHSGHVRFFEEASAYGDVYVGVGSDANVRALKGEGHPLFPENERAYMVQAVRYVKQAFISSGSGWLDAEAEIAVIRPHVYVVNEDGDRPEKRDFCRNAGIDYIVLRRDPKPGLPRRDSTRLRGF